MVLSVLASSWLSLVAVFVLLVGVPLLVVGVLAVASGYIQHDAERMLEEEVERNQTGADPDKPDDGSDPRFDE